MGNDDRDVRRILWNKTRRDTAKSPFTKRPYLSPQHLQTHLDQAMVQMHQHYIVASVGQSVVEDD
jgi:hypothetical protein